MKTYASAILMITICILTFLSCSKKKDDIPAASTNYGSVVFWTKNSAKLALCGGAIGVYMFVPTPFGAAVTNTALIRYILLSAPTYCGNEAAMENIIPGKNYYSLQNCSTGQFGPLDSFLLSPGECLKIEIP